MEYKRYHLNRLFNELKNRLEESDSSSSHYGYVDFIERCIQDEEIFKTFRGESAYKDILEHINDDLSQKYYFSLREKLTHKEIVSLCKVIKNIGNPYQMKFGKSSLNPTTLRYINVALDLKKKFPNKDFKKIVELGAGFGGQALILREFYNIENYHFIDLPQVNQLIQKFILLHKPSFEYSFSQIETFKESQNYDLFLSNYAFSELPKKLQIKSIKNVTSKVKSGYMIVNNFSDISFRYLSKKGYNKYFKNLQIHPEIPESYIFNKILLFENQVN